MAWQLNHNFCREDIYALTSTRSFSFKFYYIDIEKLCFHVHIQIARMQPAKLYQVWAQAYGTVESSLGASSNMFAVRQDKSCIPVCCPDFAYPIYDIYSPVPCCRAAILWLAIELTKSDIETLVHVHDDPG